MKKTKVQFTFGDSELSDIRTSLFFFSGFGQFRIMGNERFITGLDFNTAGVLPGEEITDLMKECEFQLKEYFLGKRMDFELPVYVRGTPYNCSVWRELLHIPYGETISYSLLAKRIGNPGSVRAAGHANSRNPVSVIIPCHRVVGSSGNLTGYAGGLKLKKQLIDHEKLHSGQILDLKFE